MEFLVFVIYGIVMSEWIFGKASKNTGMGIRGRDYYKVSGMLNMITGMIGMLLFNSLLRGKDIIPEWSFWAGFIGFALIMILGMYYFIKMMISLE